VQRGIVEKVTFYAARGTAPDLWGEIEGRGRRVGDVTFRDR